MYLWLRVTSMDTRLPISLHLWLRVTSMDTRLPISLHLWLRVKITFAQAFITLTGTSVTFLPRSSFSSAEW